MIFGNKEGGGLKCTNTPDKNKNIESLSVKSIDLVTALVKKCAKSTNSAIGQPHDQGNCCRIQPKIFPHLQIRKKRRPFLRDGENYRFSYRWCEAALYAGVEDIVVIQFMR